MKTLKKGNGINKIYMADCKTNQNQIKNKSNSEHFNLKISKENQIYLI